MPNPLAEPDTQLIALVAAPLLIVVVIALAILLTRRLRSNRLQVTALDHELFVHGRSADRKIGEFSGFAHAVAFADRQNGRGPKQTMYLVSDPAKPAPIWIRVEEIEGLNHDRRRVVGYATGTGSDHDDPAALRSECRRRGWHLVEVVHDAGDRAALQFALELISGGEATCLLTVHLDRLAYTAFEFANLLEWFEEANASLVTLEPPLDTSTDEGKRMARVITSLGEAERAHALQSLESAPSEPAPIEPDEVIVEPDGSALERRLLGFGERAVRRYRRLSED